MDVIENQVLYGINDYSIWLIFIRSLLKNLRFVEENNFMDKCTR